MLAEATSGASVVTSGLAASVFGGLMYVVLRYVAQPWVYFSNDSRARRVILAVPVLCLAGGVIAILVGLLIG
jgi:hypothetical protein